MQKAWMQVPVSGWLEAIQTHPRLGDIQAVHKKRGSSATNFALATAAEQDDIVTAGQQYVNHLTELNHKYEAKFGHVFLLFAKGRSAQQVVRCLEERFVH